MTENRQAPAAPSLAKRCCEIAAAIVVAPLAVVYWLSTLPRGPEQAFPGWSQWMSLIPGTTGVFFRRAFYRFVLPVVGRDACLTFGTVFSHPTARIGDRVYVGVGCMLGDVTLEEDVLLGSHVSIINGQQQHGIERLDVPIREQPGRYPHVTVGRDSWIGDRALVMADVGCHCIVGAGSVVTRPVPDYAVVVGNPARVLRYRNRFEPGGEAPAGQVAGDGGEIVLGDCSPSSEATASAR